MPLPYGSDEIVEVDFSSPLPVTALGNQYILLFTYRFSRRTARYAVTTAEFTAPGMANILLSESGFPFMELPSEVAFG